MMISYVFMFVGILIGYALAIMCIMASKQSRKEEKINPDFYIKSYTESGKGK